MNCCKLRTTCMERSIPFKENYQSTWFLFSSDFGIVGWQLRGCQYREKKEGHFLRPSWVPLPQCKEVSWISPFLLLCAPPQHSCSPPKRAVLWWEATEELQSLTSSFAVSTECLLLTAGQAAVQLGQSAEMCENTRGCFQENTATPILALTRPPSLPWLKMLCICLF